MKLVCVELLVKGTVIYSPILIEYYIVNLMML